MERNREEMRLKTDGSRIFYLMGKSGSGKDTLYASLLQDEELSLSPLVLYTTRPARSGETDGVTYFFVSEDRLKELEQAGKVIELRQYHTVHGIWSYFTVDDGQVTASRNGAEGSAADLLAIGTLESYQKLRSYYGENRILPIYIEVEDGLRLFRALARERAESRPRYEEMCRRFLADQEDFSEQQLAAAQITRRFSNNGRPEECQRAVRDYILDVRQHTR